MEDPYKNCHGIVLYTADWKDSSRIVDLFTREHGRLTFLAKGVRRPKSRFVNLTEPFVEGVFNLQSGRSTYYLKEGVLYNAHLPMRRDIARLTSATYLCELVRLVLIEAEPDEAVFYLLQAGLEALSQADREGLPRVLAAFLLKLSSFLGFRPTFSRCVVCGGPLDDSGIFNLTEGGMCCREHVEEGSQIVRLNLDEYVEMMEYVRKPLRELTRPDEKTSGLLMHRLMNRYFRIHVGKTATHSESMLHQWNLL